MPRRSPQSPDQPLAECPFLAQPTPSAEDRFLALTALFIGPISKGSSGSILALRRPVWQGIKCRILTNSHRFGRCFGRGSRPVMAARRLPERPIGSAARRPMSGSADGSVRVEIGIGEAAGATVEKRCDAQEVIVAPARCAATLNQGSTWPDSSISSTADCNLSIVRSFSSSPQSVTGRRRAPI
jgi:hypothetical protein